MTAMTISDPHTRARLEFEAARDAEAITQELEQMAAADGIPADYSVVRMLGALRRIRGLSS
jgi:hypothetical protein